VPEEQTYSPPALAPSYNPPDADFEYQTELPSYNTSPDQYAGNQSNVPKRQASGFYVGKPPIYTNAIGTPDIWNMFSQEWGQRRSTRRRGRW